jgi:hypothetical protein
MSQVMNPPTETDVMDDDSSDASYEPGWYAVLRGPVVATNHSSHGLEDPKATSGVDNTLPRGLFRRHSRRHAGV